MLSSPSNGIVSARDGYISKEPQSPNYGDVHYYFTFGDVWQWSVYPSAKFVSEYGFQSWSSLTTLQKYISPSQLKYPLEKGLEHREHQENGLLYLKAMILANLPLPSNGSTSRLADYIYLSQVHQAMAIKIETEFYRRNRQVTANGEGFTMGALYWQLNDIWPTVSWASIEYGGKWKMLHYYARNMFDNLLVDAYEDERGLLSVVITRDDHIQLNIPFKVTLDIFKWSSSRVLQHQGNSTTQPFSVTLAYQQSTEQLLRSANCTNRNDCFAHVHIAGNLNGELIERSNFLLLGKIKDAIGLERAHITVSDLTGPKRDQFGVNTFTLHLTSDRIAPFVWLDFSPEADISGIFSDNGFFLTGPKNVTFRTVENVTLKTLNSSVVIKSLKDVQ